MRARSFIAICFVFVIFVGIQGWIFLHKFWYPKVVEAGEAILMASVLTVGTPVPGTIHSVHVVDAQWVGENQVLFLVIPQTPEDPLGSTPIPIIATQSGVIMDIAVVQGEFVQASERLARIVDIRHEARFVQARFPLEPKDRRLLRPFLRAKVTAPFLNDGAAIDAVVTSVNPVYDARTGTIEAKLRLLDMYIEEAESVGLPVKVEIAIENENEVKDRIQWVLHQLAPATFGSPLP